MDLIARDSYITSFEPIMYTWKKKKETKKSHDNPSEANNKKKE